MKPGDIVEIKGVEKLILLVDPYGGHVAVSVENLNKRVDAVATGEIPPEAGARKLIDHLRIQRPDLKEVLDAWQK